MADEKQGRGTMAVLGGAAVAVVAVLLGVLYWETREVSPSQTEATAPAPQTQAPASPKPPVNRGQPAPAMSKPADAAKAGDASPPPSFDVVRVEPDGESVIAGRAAPGATIELLRGDHVHARAAADASGLFAIVPPPLPIGSHQIVLQAIAPDGTRQRSLQSVTVVIGDAKTRPLVALTAPDKPTVLLSNPETPDAKATQEAKPVQTQPATDAKTAEAPAPAQQQANAVPQATTPAPRADIKIVSVESEDGKLFVSGQTAPGATVRLYLNESFIAPGGAGADGKVSFAIGSGVKPGDYRVRLDDVDPVSGQVKSRAEVPFNVPAQVASAEAAAPAPQAAQPQAPVGVPSTGNKMASASPGAAAGTVVIPNINTAIVSKGDNLWRISQRTYGKGYRYTVIYGANQDQIRNPDLIYPGQVFVLPGDQTGKTN